MARNEQLIRQHKILQILERVRYGKMLEEIRDDLVDELGLKSLHTRSVRRDLEALQAAGIDVDSHDSGRGRVWKLGPRAKSTYKITASATELIALSLGRDLLYPLAGTPFWIGIESFWNKIQEELPATVTDHYEKYLMKGADFIILGEGEFTLKELVSRLNKEEEISNLKGIVFKKERHCFYG